MKAETVFDCSSWYYECSPVIILCLRQNNFWIHLLLLRTFVFPFSPACAIICSNLQTTKGGTAMISGELKNKIDALWETFWTGGLTNPLTVIE